MSHFTLTDPYCHSWITKAVNMSYVVEVEVSVNPNLIGALVNLNASPLSKAHVATTNTLLVDRSLLLPTTCP